MNRVVVTKPFCGLVAMQVCACKDATDEEILDVCNKENRAGTSNGWMQVLRTEDQLSNGQPKECLPIQCEDAEDRLHFLVYC